ncbi:MAG: hypothetical protein JWO02_93 [Solirubrobacterales bacterium]|nr:hypothetical protein [Solirubrobacterales bacterium]
MSVQEPPGPDEPPTEATKGARIDEPAPFAPPERAAAPEPTPTVPASEASWSRPAGSAAPPTSVPAADAFADRPEVLVGAAFAGGFVAALILKRLGR